MAHYETDSKDSQTAFLLQKFSLLPTLKHWVDSTLTQTAVINA